MIPECDARRTHAHSSCQHRRREGGEGGKEKGRERRKKEGREGGVRLGGKGGWGEARR